MWFRSIYLKTFRDLRIPIFGWGVGLGLLMAVVLAAIPTVLATASARAAVVALGASFAWIAAPIKIDTPGGYATWKYGITILIVAIWPILAATGLLRGEEERGSLDSLLSMPRQRARVALEKLAALWTALLAMGLVIAVLTYIGGAKVNAGISIGAAVGFGVNLALICAVFGGIALLISQFTQERRTAAGWASGALLLFIVLDMVHRVVPNADWVSRFSPVYYYNLSKPLVPGYSVDFGSFMLMLALAVLLTGSGILLFARRDIGGAVPAPGFLRRPQRSPRPPRALLQGQWSLQSVYSRSLAMVAVPTAWWTLAIAGFAAWMVVIVQQTEAQLSSLLQGSAAMRDFLKLGGSGAGTSASILSAMYIFLPLLLMAFAVTQANRWSADENDGRLELVLSTPHSRVRVLFGRFAALSTATVLISLVTLAASELAALATGVKLDGGNLAAATLSMIPLGLLVAALGYLLSGWLRSAVETGLLSFILVIWFFISFIGPGVNLPDATLRLSALYYYGSPLLHGLQPTSMLGVLAVAALALGLSALRFSRKDIAA